MGAQITVAVVSSIVFIYLVAIVLTVFVRAQTYAINHGLGTYDHAHTGVVHDA